MPGCAFVGPEYVAFGMNVALPKVVHRAQLPRAVRTARPERVGEVRLGGGLSVQVLFHCLAGRVGRRGTVDTARAGGGLAGAVTSQVLGIGVSSAK